MKVKKTFLAVICSLALLLVSMPISVFAADEESYVDLVDASASVTAGTCIGSAGNTFPGGGAIEVLILVSGKTAHTLKILGSPVNGGTATAVIYGPGCGAGVIVPIDGNMYTVTTSLNNTGKVTFSVGVNNSVNCRISFFLYE